MANTVLLVDDDARVLYGLARVLRQQPYQLYTARSGEEAIRMIKLHDIDVLVVDEKMPGMSGGDVLAWVAKNYPDIVRIVLTGCATVETTIRAINEGAVFQFFTKPCNDGHLAVAIRKALEHKTRMQENSHLVDVNRRRVQSLGLYRQDLEILTRIVAQDLRRPCDQIEHSCRSLLKRYQDYLDPKALSLSQAALEAVGEVQRLLGKLLNHVEAKESARSSGGGCASGNGSSDASSLSVPVEDY